MANGEGMSEGARTDILTSNASTRVEALEEHFYSLPGERLMTLTRFWGVGEEKFGTMDTGGFNGQVSTNLYERIQTTSGKII